MGPALEKLRRCTPLFNPQDEVLNALVELVQRQGWNNSLQDLASSIGALTDDQVKFKTNSSFLLELKVLMQVLREDE